MEFRLKRKQKMIKQTRQWVESIVVGNGFCPFARPVLERGSIHYDVVLNAEIEECLGALLQACLLLDERHDVDTSLIIFGEAFEAFDDYLHFVHVSELLLNEQGYEGVYQLASFHPDYRFAGAAADDPANFTNRSVYPMLHLLRESSVEAALVNYETPERIPERNIQYARAKGLAQMQSTLQACKSIIGGVDD